MIHTFGDEIIRNCFEPRTARITADSTLPHPARDRLTEPLPAAT